MQGLGLTESQAKMAVELQRINRESFERKAEQESTNKPTTASVSSLMNMENALLLREIRSELRAMSAKWLNRERAADYLSTSPSTIDKWAGKGKLRKRYLGTTPVFLKEDLDALVTDQAVKEEINKKLKEVA